MDQSIFHLINEQWTNPALDLFMAVMSNVDVWKPFLVILVLLALILGGFRARACIVCLLVTLLICEQGTRILKSGFARARPKQVERVRLVQLQRSSPEFLTVFKKPTIRYSDETDRNRSGPSFPSGHTTNNTAIATVLTMFYRRRGALYWIVTATIGYSRIYLGAHWPSDVAITSVLALGETLLVVTVMELLWRRLGPICAPKIFARHPRLVAKAEQASILPPERSQAEGSRYSQ